MKFIKYIAHRARYLSWIWLLVTTLLLVTSGNKFPKTDFGNIPYFDKLVHIGLFALLSWLFIMGYARIKKTHQFSRPSVWQIFLIVTLYGIAMEFVQKYWVPYRSFEVSDILADTIGVILGTAIALKQRFTTA